MNMKTCKPAYIYPSVLFINNNPETKHFGETDDLGATFITTVRGNDQAAIEENGTNKNKFVFVFGITKVEMNTKVLRGRIGTAIAEKLTIHTNPHLQPLVKRTPNNKEMKYNNPMIFKYGGDTTDFGPNPIRTTAITTETSAIQIVLGLYAGVDGNIPTPSEAAEDHGVVSAIYGPENMEYGKASLREIQGLHNSLLGPQVTPLIEN
jgi:hypothetical protein